MNRIQSPPGPTFQRWPEIFSNNPGLNAVTGTDLAWLHPASSASSLVPRPPPPPTAPPHCLARLYFPVQTCYSVTSSSVTSAILPTILYGRWDKHFHLQLHRGKWRPREVK